MPSTTPRRLTRSATMPIGGRTSTSRTGRSTGRTKAAKTARRSKAGKKRTLKAAAQTLRREATVAAEAAVMGLREEKYFNATYADAQSHPVEPTTGSKRCSIKAFATTGNTDGAGNVMQYCGSPIVALGMLNPFKSTAANPAARALAPDGKFVYPSRNSVSWMIDRNYTRMGLVGVGTSGAYAPPATGVNDTELVNMCPIRCRMVHVTPKLAAGIQTEVDPTTDLFLDQYGNSYSPGSGAFNFTYSDCEYASINTRVYSVLGDKTFTLRQPMNGGWVTDYQISTAQFQWEQVVAFPPGQCSKKMVTNHQLAQKKGGSVYFEDPENQTNASTGHRREYILFHFWYESNDGGGTTPSLAGPGIVPKEEEIKIHFRTESRFKDA